MTEERLGLRLAILIGVLLAGCNRNQAVTSMGAAGPAAWIDAPLNGVTIHQAAYPVVFHATAPGGVASAEWSVNGTVLASDTNPDPSALLVSFQHEWTPRAPGVYTHRVRTQATSGSWSEYAVAVVTVGYLTSTPSPTPTPATITPTVTPTPTPTPTAFGVFGATQLSGNGFYYGSGGCSPSQVSIGVTITWPSDVKVVVFFYRLKDTKSGETTEWSEGQSMNPASGGVYNLTLTGNSIGPAGGFAEAYVLYQFVAQMKDGTMPRSPAYNDVVLARCGWVILPLEILPPIDIFPITATPEFVK